MTIQLDGSSQTHIHALSGYLALLGILYERTGLLQTANREIKSHFESLKSKFALNNAGKATHLYAAYTALALEDITPLLPQIIQDNINTFIQDTAGFLITSDKDNLPLIKEALQTAIGFEVNPMLNSLEADESDPIVRLSTLFEKIDLDLPHEGRTNNPTTNRSNQYVYPLTPLSIDGLFPTAHKTVDKKTAQKDYQALWETFKAGLSELNRKIEVNDMNTLVLWIDAFDSLWLTITHAVPASTKVLNASHLSLYDLSKTTASLAVALAGHQHEAKLAATSASTKPYLMIQGDFFGIQDFIFTTGGASNKHANKLLRGRSFYVSLMSEIAALHILSTLNLPSTSQVMNAAGKFTIVAPNTHAIKTQLENIKRTFNDWFLKNTYGVSGIGIAMTEASREDFISDPNHENSKFSALQSQLFAQLEKAKFQRFGFGSSDAPQPVFTDFLSQFDNTLGVCEIDGKRPAELTYKGENLSKMAADHISLGELLVSSKPLICISKADLLPHKLGVTDKNSLRIDIFGYWVIFLDDHNSQQKELLDILIQSGHIARCWDIALPKITAKQDKTTPINPIFHGFARRFINGYVPIFPKGSEANLFELERYDANSRTEVKDRALKNLQQIACEDKMPPDASNQASTQWLGVNALHTLKGDVDDLGAIFQSGLKQASFARMASLSRQINFFFSLWLPAYCAKSATNTYTVFAGGDDFFLIGPWRSTTLLAKEMYQHFKHYVAYNPQIHFSAGLIQTKAGVPIRFLSESAEQALEQAKQHYAPDSKDGNISRAKNSVNIYGINVKWAQFEKLIESAERLKSLKEEYDIQLSTAYLYGLLELSEMADKASIRPEAAIWRSYLVYRTQRNVIEKIKMKPNESKEQFDARKRERSKKLRIELGDNLERYKLAYQIAIQHLLYQYRLR